MHSLRRLISLLLITAMLFSLSCEAFAETITLPAALEEIGEEAFYGDESLDEVVVPYGAAAIGPRAFAYSGVKRITIPDTVTQIAEDAFEGVENAVIYSSDMSHAKWYADEYGLGWENTDQYYWQEREEAISHLSDIPEFIHNISELEFTLEEIVPEDVNDQETLSLIVAYNESVRSLRNEVETLNSAIRSAKQAFAELEALSENDVIDVSDSGYSVRWDDFSFSVRGDAYSALNGKCELLSSEILEDGTVEYTLLSENGETFYLITSEDGLEASYQSHATVPDEAFTDALMVSMPGAELKADGDPAWYESPVIDGYGTFMDSVTMIADGSALTSAASASALNASVTLYTKGVLTAQQASIALSSANALSTVSNSPFSKSLQYLTDTSTNCGKTLGGLNVVATGFSVGNILNKLDDLYIIKNHNHPTDGEVKSDESYELVMQMCARMNQAVAGYSLLLQKAGCDTALTIASWGQSGLVWSAANVLTAGSNLSFFRMIEKDAEESYKVALYIHNMLHYSVSGTVRDENTRQPLSGVSVDCEAAGHEVMHGTTDENGKYYFEPLSLNLKLTFKKAGYGEVVKTVTSENETLDPNIYDVTRDAELSASSWGAVTDELTGDLLQGITVTLDGELSTVTNEHGEFTFHYEGMHTRAHTFTLKAEGYINATYQAHVGQNTLPLAFTIKAKSKAYGKVTSKETGAALSGVKVTMTDTSTHAQRVAYTNTDGLYSFPGIPSTYTLSFTKESFDPIPPIRFEIAIVGYNRYDAQMPAKADALSGTVTDSATGAVLSGVTVTLDGSRTASTDADGRYSFSNVAQGAHSLLFRKTGYADVEMSITTASGSSDFDICMQLKDASQPSNLRFYDWCVSQFDRNADGKLSRDEILNVTSIDCRDLGFTSLSGIENFSNLAFLVCEGNQLTSLDLSNCSALERLWCEGNKLTSLDLSNCSALETLACGENQLTSLKLSNCSALEGLGCFNNRLTSLDLSGCSALTWLTCYDNQLTSLKLSGCSALKSLSCDNNRLTSLDLSNCSALTLLHCEGNQLTSLKLSGCSALTSLGCSNNLLTSLDLSNCSALEMLSCNDTQLTSLDFSGCPALTIAYCSSNQLTRLKLSGCSALTTLYCDCNQLASLDLSACFALTVMSCDDNQLTSLDFSSCPALEWLHCSGNQLTSLDLSGCTQLSYLDCRNNLLKTIDVSDCFNLKDWNNDCDSGVQIIR